jgi:hypothetical protein
LAGSDNSAEVKALVSMLLISLVMGAGVLYFKKDYNLKDIWLSNKEYYPNAGLEAHDPLAQKTDPARFSDGDLSKSKLDNPLKPGTENPKKGGSKDFKKDPEKERQELLDQIQKAAEAFYSSSPTRPDLEGEAGIKEYLDNYDGDRADLPVFTQEAR